MAGKGHPPLATSHYSLAPESRTFVQARPNLLPTPSPMHNGFDLDFPRNQSFSARTRHNGLNSHSCGLQCPLGRQLPNAGTAGRIPAGAGYPYIGDSSRKLSFHDTFRTPVAPKLEFSRNTHPCGWQGSSSPSNFPLLTSSRKSTFVQARPNLPPTPSPMHNGFDLDFPRNQSFSARTATWAEFPLMLVLLCPLGRQLPKAGTAGRIPAGAGYPYIGDSSRKLSFHDTFRTPVAPKPEFFRNTHPCGWQGSSSPSNFPLLNSSRKSTFVQARPNLPPTPSPMHNGFDLDFPRNQSFPARTATWAEFPLMWSTMPTRSPTPESGHSRENTSRSRVPLYRRFQQEIIISRHVSYPRSS